MQQNGGRDKQSGQYNVLESTNSQIDLYKKTNDGYTDKKNVNQRNIHDEIINLMNNNKTNEIIDLIKSLNLKTNIKTFNDNKIKFGEIEIINEVNFNSDYNNKK